MDFPPFDYIQPFNFLHITSKRSIALLIYGAPGSGRNAITEEKYQKLAAYLAEKEFEVASVCYHDSIAGSLETDLEKFGAVLVWVNPIEQGGDRKRLDALLRKVASQGVFVSAHPDVILKMGTKEILYKIKDEEFGSDVKLYHSFKEFKEKFLTTKDPIRILKQYRGNGGKGVFKIDLADLNNERITVTEATQGDVETSFTAEGFLAVFKDFFGQGNMLIDQAWNPGITNGMVRCYLSGDKVAGFGYQEINALYPKMNAVFRKPSQRFYFSENCGLFSDLKKIMEEKWIGVLQKITRIETEMLPVIWDADFFIKTVNSENAKKKYSLCEINTSSVSPFPESAIPFMADLVRKYL